MLLRCMYGYQEAKRRLLEMSVLTFIRLIVTAVISSSYTNKDTKLLPSWIRTQTLTYLSNIHYIFVEAELR